MESECALIPYMPQHNQHRHEPESSTAPHAEYGKPRSLNLRRKVFLSHSGKDKPFARRLYRDLCRCYHGFEVAFLDDESLPKGKPIDMKKSILEEARGSALGVLILTDDFFMYTRNPMLELEAFVACNVDLLPLFYKMSVDQFKEKERWDKWEKKWEEWAAKDDKLVIDKWRSYLKFVMTYNGLEFCKIAPENRDDLYIDDIVKRVACIIGPAVPMSGKDVYGKGRLCRMVDDMYKSCTYSKRSSPIDHYTATQTASTSGSPGLGEINGLLYAYNDVVGIHGFSGLGKTTLCKCLCDFYFGEMMGKVCYIDLGLSSDKLRLSRMQHVLSRLDRGNIKDFHSLQLENDQVEYLLNGRLSSSKDPVFLAIDNISPGMECGKEALIYLRCQFAKGSKILITSKSERVLTKLITLLSQYSDNVSAVIKYMPALDFKEARAIFKHEFPGLPNPGRSNLSGAELENNIQRDVDACVHKCTIFEGKRYHPLMLKSLAAYVIWDELTPSFDCLDWKDRLAKLASEGIVHMNDAWANVFQVFDITFTRLAKEAKKMFLDLALCYCSPISKSFNSNSNFDYYDWIQMVHDLKDREMEEFLLQLHHLCFIVMEGPTIGIHGLMVEFGKYKAGAAGAVLEDGAHWLDALPRTASHVIISGCGKELRTLDLSSVKGVTVLHLLDNAGLEEVILSRNISARLRSMIVSVPAGTRLTCIVDKNWSSQSLKWLQLKGNFSFCLQARSQRSLILPAARMDDLGAMLLRSFRNLGLLELHSVLPGSVQRIDLTPLANLKRLEVSEMSGLKSIRGPESSSHLEEVLIWGSPDLEELAFTVPADSKPYFVIHCCDSLRRVSLNCRTSPSISYGAARATAGEIEGGLTIFACPRFANVDGLSQYTGDLSYYICDPENGDQQDRFWTEAIVDMVKYAGIDFSRCKATVRKLILHGNNPAGLLIGGVRVLKLVNAQHIWPLISAMFQAQPTYLEDLKIRCVADGSCGCDRDAPNFGTFPWPRRADHVRTSFKYWCPQVRDLASLAHWRTLRRLRLSGCMNVEVWPDFAAMTSLKHLDLSFTSLKEWPAGVLLLPDLSKIILGGCRQLPEKELIIGAIKPTHHWDSETSWHLASKHEIYTQAIRTLESDLYFRSTCTVADALGALSPELAAFFDRWSPDSIGETKILEAVLALIHAVWSSTGNSTDEEHMHVTEIMRGLLSSESFLSLPLRAGNGDTHTSAHHVRFLLGMLLGLAALGGGEPVWVSESLPPDSDRHRLRDSSVIFFKNRILSLSNSQLKSIRRILGDQLESMRRFGNYN